MMIGSVHITIVVGAREDQIVVAYDDRLVGGLVIMK